MTRQPPPDLPEHKPIEEMTREERLAYARELARITRKELAELNQPGRERKLHAGLVTPRTGPSGRPSARTGADTPSDLRADRA